MLWNYLRFENPMETGYSLIHLEGFLAERVNAHSHFNIHYLPFNLFHMFIKGLDFAWREPSLLLPLKTDAFGTSLTVASPFVLFAFKAVWKKNVTIGAWAAILVILIPAMLYYNNGWIQVNCQRFSLDFMPVLILLAAKGIGSRKLFKIAVVWAISLNIISFGTVYVSQLLY